MRQQASLTLKKITVAVGICMVANFASYQVYAAVPACPPVITPVWEYAMNAAGKAIKGSLVAHYNALDLQWEANLKPSHRLAFVSGWNFIRQSPKTQGCKPLKCDTVEG